MTAIATDATEAIVALATEATDASAIVALAAVTSNILAHQICLINFLSLFTITREKRINDIIIKSVPIDSM